MKDILIAYSSRTGNTEKVAKAIFEAAPSRCDIKRISEVKGISNYNLIIIGYWIDKGLPSQEARDFLTRLDEKNIAVFQTLGANPSGEHAMACFVNAGKLLPKTTKVLGALSLRGAISPQLIAAMSKLPKGHPHSPSPETRARWEAAASHPDAADLKSAQTFMLKIIDLYDKYYKK